MSSSMPGLHDLGIKVVTEEEMNDFEANRKSLYQLDRMKNIIKEYEAQYNIDEYKDRDEYDKPIYEALKKKFFDMNSSSSRDKCDSYDKHNTDEKYLFTKIDESNKKRKTELNDIDNVEESVLSKWRKNNSPYTPSAILDVKKNERRREFMNKIFTGCRKIPVYQMKIRKGFSLPQLVGALPQDNDHLAETGDLVAALVHNTDHDEKVWMLAVVEFYNMKENVYGISDVDFLGAVTVYVVPTNGVICLPHYRANPKLDKYALHKEGERVMAVFPGTSLFLIGTVERRPVTIDDDYVIVLNHPKFTKGISRPQHIPQRLVISMSNPHII